MRDGTDVSFVLRWNEMFYWHFCWTEILYFKIVCSPSPATLGILIVIIVGGIIAIIQGAYEPHWGRVTHICVGELTTIGSDNGLSPGRRQAIIWTNAGILLIRTVGTNFSEVLIEIQTFSLKKIRLKMSSAKWCPFRLGLNVLRPSLGLRLEITSIHRYNVKLHFPTRV